MAARRVEVAGRLIRQQHQRFGGDGARDGDALLLSARKLGWRMMLAALKAYEMQRMQRPLPPFAPGNAFVDERQFDIFEGRGALQ